jgi:hypothetical protein
VRSLRLAADASVCRDVASYVSTKRSEERLIHVLLLLDLYLLDLYCGAN